MRGPGIAALLLMPASRAASSQRPIGVVFTDSSPLLRRLQRLHQGVVRDLERLERKKENLRLLEQQKVLTRHLEEERRRAEARLRPQDT